jgi:hypothetical protein
MSQMSKVIEYERLKLLSGLDWHPTDMKRKNIQKLSKEFGSEFYAAFGRKHDVIQEQIGLYHGDDSKNNRLSLAVLVLSQIDEPDALVVIDFDDHVYALVAIDSGLITHDLTGSKDEVQKQFLNLVAKKDFKAKFAPEGWSSSDTEAFVLDVALAKKNKSAARLKPVNVKIHKVLIPMVLVGVALYGVNAWYEYQAEQERAAQLAEIQRLKALKNKPKPVVYPWNQSVPASTTWHACEAMYMPMNLYPAGWKYSSIGCNAAGLTVSFKRQVGNVSGLVSAFPNATVDMTGNSAVVNVKHDPVLPNVDIPIQGLPDSQQAINRLLTLSQDYQFTLQLSPMQSKALPGQQPNATKPYTQLKVSITSSIMPIGNIVEMIDLKTFVDTTYTSTDLTSWKIQGVLYVKP